MKNIKWREISKYREELFGLAIVSIIVMHYFDDLAQAEYINWSFIKTIARYIMVLLGA